MKLILFLLSFIFLPLLANSSTILQLEINGAIGPASSAYLKDGINKATQINSKFVLIKLDTLEKLKNISAFLNLIIKVKPIKE